MVVRDPLTCERGRLGYWVAAEYGPPIHPQTAMHLCGDAERMNLGNIQDQNSDVGNPRYYIIWKYLHQGGTLALVSTTGLRHVGQPSCWNLIYDLADVIKQVIYCFVNSKKYEG